MTHFFWDNGRWDEAEWAGTPPPEQTWGTDWAWWYQTAGTVQIVLNPLLVEARWTTDSHTLGDGTFHGDIQPGTLTARFSDPEHELDDLNKQGAVWAMYKPTGACWCWFYDSFTRGLFAPGDPAAADCVFTGTLWPSRLTSQGAGFPVQSVAARLAGVVSNLNTNTNLALPAVTGSVAAQAQTLPASVTDQNNLYPSHLASIRTAAANGVAWMAATAAPPGPGALVLNYARWETTNARTLDKSQVVAGPAVTASTDFLVTLVGWAATLSSGASSALSFTGPGAAGWGYLGPTAMRIIGDVTVSTGPEYSACYQTAQRLCSDRANPDEQYLNTISLQSGLRWTAAGKPAVADWDPYAHVFAPTDVMTLDTGSGPKQYRVTKSDHRLTADVWQTTHYLDTFTAATPLP